MGSEGSPSARVRILSTVRVHEGRKRSVTQRTLNIIRRQLEVNPRKHSKEVKARNPALLIRKRIAQLLDIIKKKKIGLKMARSDYGLAHGCLGACNKGRGQCLTSAPTSHRPGAHMSHTHVTVDARMEDLVYPDPGRKMRASRESDEQWRSRVLTDSSLNMMRAPFIITAIA
ncbi:hypothetical protein E2C01_032420 [Portunus trituberculatus]|uniref:Uncharacterized protein n=1 Tax=Portunus trituberculatus TaxID=210409 RepID=A0A5B7F1B8_PORTR|nr:hypothetical protein [Portunus trituberculatus]